MSDVLKDQIATILPEVVIELLADGEEVHIPGLGTFRLQHEESEMEKKSEGRVLMKPPRDTIMFAPDL